ncbi:butyrophilin subfamily 1 member A1-like [Odontesthes bonariensis]|uniref:butyrophilin subfamily 1 member A1-like n=1 Tax=Odontesthes bonariensis TaxID=219752 RepID=UPI003F58B74C
MENFALLGMCLSLAASVFGEHRTITAEPGQDVTLTCRAPNNNNTIIAVKWSRTDLGEEYVLVYRDGQFYLEGQHPSFKDRVYLQDRQMKDGDVSLILKDVTTEDRGTYECRVVQEGRNQEREKTSTFIHLAVVEPEQKIITAEPGQDVTLTCRAPNNNNIPIVAVEWGRADLDKEYVLLYRDGHYDPHNQHPSFKNRVDLQDRQMKDGDVSLILRNVTTADRGTYECRVKQKGTKRRRRANLTSDPIIIFLEVVPAGHTDGSRDNGESKDRSSKGENGGGYGLIVSAIIFTVAVIALYVNCKIRLKENSKIPSSSGENSVV